MATDKNITMKQYNGSDYDTLYPATKGSQILTPVPVASGGLGANTAAAGVNNIITPLSTITPASNDIIPLKDVSANTGAGATITQLVSSLSSNGVVTSSNIAEQAAAAGFGRIQTGSYVGTGTYGASNPCSLTFDFEPAFVIIINSVAPPFGAISPVVPIVWCPGVAAISAPYITTNNNSSYRSTMFSYFGGKTLKYFSGGQFSGNAGNVANVTYSYVAFGKDNLSMPTEYVMTTSGIFTVPYTGNYYLELHGTSGLGSGSNYYGSGSGQVYNSISLTQGTQIQVTVNSGTQKSGASFGAYSVDSGGDCDAYNKEPAAGNVASIGGNTNSTSGPNGGGLYPYMGSGYPGYGLETNNPSMGFGGIYLKYLGT